MTMLKTIALPLTALLLLPTAACLKKPVSGDEPVARRDVATEVTYEVGPRQCLYMVRVLGPDGRPIEKAQAAVVTEKPEEYPPRTRQRLAFYTTDSQGYVPLTIDMGGDAKYIWVGGRHVVDKVIKAPPKAGGQRLDLSVQTESGHDMTVEVSWPGGQPWNRASVYVNPWTDPKNPSKDYLVWRYKTDTTGKLVLKLKPGPYTVRVADDEVAQKRDTFKRVDLNQDLLLQSTLIPK